MRKINLLAKITTITQKVHVLSSIVLKYQIKDSNKIFRNLQHYMTENLNLTMQDKITAACKCTLISVWQWMNLALEIQRNKGPLQLLSPDSNTLTSIHQIQVIKKKKKAASHFILHYNNICFPTLSLSHKYFFFFKKNHKQ